MVLSKTLLAFFIFAMFAVLITIARPEQDLHFHKVGGVEKIMGRGASEHDGSSPPSCERKCGTCTPCVRVIGNKTPGLGLAAPDYKPDVWKCKCGGKLYNP